MINQGIGFNSQVGGMTIDYNAKLNSEWDNIKDKAISKLEEYLLTGNAQVMFTRKEYM
jgi:hypothetical protein